MDVKGLDGMRDLHLDPGTCLTVGAAVTMNWIIASADVQACYLLLAEACWSVASYQLRTRATVTGDIWNASLAGDTIGACFVFNAELQIPGVDSPRRRVKPLARIKNRLTSEFLLVLPRGYFIYG